MRVQVNGRLPLIKQTTLELPNGDEVVATLVYERLERHCSTCLKLDHEERDCLEAKAQRRALAAASETKDNLKENQGSAPNREETFRRPEVFQFSSSGHQGGRDRRNYNPERRYAHDHRRGQAGVGSEKAYRSQGRPQGGSDAGRSQHQSWERRDNYSRSYSNRQVIYREVQSKDMAAGSHRRDSSGLQREKDHESTISPAQIGTSAREVPLRKETTDLTNHQMLNDADLLQEAVEEAMGEVRG
ncbi:unnamed protein product [Brassica rapa subsp. trilocularis]